MIDREFEKTLFVSDLDGTLMGHDPSLTPECETAIRALVDAGARITYSTARTYRTADKILSGVPTPYPVSLMNGVMIREPGSGRTLSALGIEPSAAVRVGKVFLEHRSFPFVYRFDGGELRTYYAELTNELTRVFYKVRAERFGKPFLKTDAFSLLLQNEDLPRDVIYFCGIEDEGPAMELYSDLAKIPGVSVAKYKGNVSGGWYIEVFSPLASKKNSVLALKRFTGSDRVISFGDNLNDLPMFEASDLCFAPRDAAPEVLARADGVIGSPEELGVAYKIAELCGVTLHL